VQPLIFEGDGEAVGAEALEVLDGGGDVGVWDQFVPEVAADEGGKSYPEAASQARLKRTMRPAVSNTATRASTVFEDGGDEVAFHGEADSMRWRERATLSIWRRA